MRKNLAFGVMFALTVVFGTAFTARAAPQTAVNGLIFGNTKAKIFDILSPQISTTIVISQVYGGGGSNSTTSPPTYKNDYVELHNVSGVAQSLNGLALQYGSAAGQFGGSANQIFALPDVTLQPGQYYLTQLGTTGTAGANLPVTPDATTMNLSLSGTSGKVALTNTATALGCGATATPCTLPDARIIDSVSYGASNNGEGGTTAGNGTALTSTQGAIRNNNGCTDTDNNNADFTVVTNPVPRNTVSPVNVCSAQTNTAPTITSANNVTFRQGTAGSFQVTASGSPAPTFSVTSGALPNGVTLSSSGLLSGTPTQSGTFTFTITATNGTAPDATQSFTLTVNAAPTTPTVNLSIAPATGTEAGTTLFTATATASATSTTDQTVSFTLTSGTAETADFTAIPATITIAAGSTTGTATFSVVDDTLTEGTENATFTISNPSAGIMLGATTTAVVNITDNDAAAASDLTITQSAPQTVAANGTLTYTLVVANSGGAITTAFDATFVLPATGFVNPTVVSDGCFTGSTITGTTVTFTGCSSLAMNGTSTLTVSITPDTAGTTLSSGTATVDSGNTVAETNEANNTAAGVSTTVNPAPISVVINEVYGGGSNSGATFNADYIELFNAGTTPAELGGYSLQYASATGNFTSIIALPSVSIPAGGVFLVQTQPSGTIGAALTPNFTSATTVNLSGTAGNVIFVAGTTAIGACPAAGAANVIDRVGYGSGTCSEGTAAPAPSNTTSIQRIPNGVDTNVNSADFRLGAGTPRAVNASQADLRISQADAPDPATAGGQVTYTLTVSNTGGADATGVAVNFTLPTGSATYTFTSAGDAGSNGFTATNNAGVINFTGGNVAAGSTATLTIVVTTTGAGTLTSTGANVIVDPNNTVAELNETNNTANSSTTTVSAAAVNPTVNLTITPSTGTEADSTQFTATVTASAASTTDQTVSFTLTGGTAGTADFTRIPATITIPANSLTGTATFSVVDDTLVEATESATFAIGNPSSGITLGTTTSASVGITDNDVAPTITLSPAALPPGTVGAAYNQTITASGGTAPYTFLVTAGVLPNGLTLNPNTGVISGTPTTATNAEFNVTATDANGFTGSRAYTITINAASIVLGNPQCQGLAVPPLRAGTTNRALMCFSLTANNGAQFTGLTVRFSTDPSLKYSNPRLVGSTDADYGTAENNAPVATGTVDNEKFTFGGFTAFTEEARAFGENNSGEALKPNLTAQPTYFFVVVDVLPTVDGSTPASTPTVSVSDITTNPPAAVTGTTATSPTPITFAPAGPSAATVNIGGRVVTARGRAIFRVRVKMTDSRGVVRSTFTNASGFYRFADVETGQVLTLSIKHKGYKFPDTTVSLNEETNSVNFKAN